jgi:hypothetical protein
VYHHIRKQRRKWEIALYRVGRLQKLSPSHLFDWRNFSKKRNSKIQKRSDFGGFQSPTTRKKKVENLQIQLFGFHLGSEKYRRMIKYFYFISDL